MNRRCVALGPVHHVGPCSVAAVEEVAIIIKARPDCPAGLAGQGGKRPLAILIATPEGPLATRPDGSPIAPRTLEALCPGALTQLTANWINQGENPMQTKDIIQYAHALYEAHGDKAEAEAAHKATEAREAGKADDAAKWDKIRMHIKELRGPKST